MSQQMKIAVTLSDPMTNIPMSICLVFSYSYDLLRSIQCLTYCNDYILLFSNLFPLRAQLTQGSESMFLCSDLAQLQVGLALYSLVLAHFVTQPGSVVPRQTLPTHTKRSFHLGTGLAGWTQLTDLAWFLIGIVGTVVAGKDLHNTLAALAWVGSVVPRSTDPRRYRLTCLLICT